MPTPRPDRHTNRDRRFPAEVLTDAEVRALMNACKGPAISAARHRALIALLYRGGLRISEALALKPKDIDLDNGTVRVLFGKGGRARTVGLDPGGVAVLRDWLEARTRANVGPTVPVFYTRSGQQLTTGYVRRLMPRLARLAGIHKRVHAHGLRHTHASQLRCEGLDIAVIRRQLGHVSIVTTVRYLDHLAPTAVIEAIRGRVWGGCRPG